jgi:hypothetical protein
MNGSGRHDDVSSSPNGDILILVVCAVWWNCSLMKAERYQWLANVVLGTASEYDFDSNYWLSLSSRERKA